MRYLMLVCTDPTAEPYVREEDTIEQWVEENDRLGRRMLGDRLRPASESRVVRVRQGGTLVTEGPFAELGEQIAGFDILDCKDLDEALDVASKHPMARFGLVELRQFWAFDES